MNRLDRRTFKVGSKDYAVVRPTVDLINKADKLSRETFNSELSAGSLLRAQLDSALRKRDLWSDQLEEEYQGLRREVLDAEFKLARGGIKLSEAKSLALEMKEKRNEMVSLLSSRTTLDSQTCEGKADAVRFNFLFANCLVNSDDSKFFPNGLDDYVLRMDDPVAQEGATEFYYLMSDTEQVDDNLPENKFLKQYKFVNESYQLVDSQGKLVDSEGRHIDENGNYIKWTSDKDFVYVDVEGREVDDDGNFAVKFEPFLDDNGKPVVLEDTPPKKRSRSKKVDDVAVAS